MKPIALQLYTLRDAAKTDFAGENRRIELAHENWTRRS